MFGAKLSWCQIVRCQIVLVPNCPGAKLSVFIILVANCPLLLSWCQIVRFIILVPNCPVPNCPTILKIQISECKACKRCKRYHKKVKTLFELLSSRPKKGHCCQIVYSTTEDYFRQFHQISNS